MKIIIITEENHGDIGVATTMKAAFQFLIGHDWLTFGFELYDKTTESWYTVRDVFMSKGLEETRENLLAWALEHENDWEVWDGAFYFHEDAIYEEEEW
jgi:hypothetical protein